MVETRSLEEPRSLILKMRTINHKKIHKKLQSDSSRSKQPLNYEISCQIFKVSNTEQRELNSIMVDQSGMVREKFKISCNCTLESIESTHKINKKSKSKKSPTGEKSKNKGKIVMASSRSI